MRGGDKLTIRPPARLRSQIDVLRLRIKTLGHFILDIIDNAVENSTAAIKVTASVSGDILYADHTRNLSLYSNASSSYRNEVPARLRPQHQQQPSRWTNIYDKAEIASPFSAAISGPPPPAPTNTSREVSETGSRVTSNNTSRRVIKPVPYAHSLTSAAHQRSRESTLIRTSPTSANTLSEHNHHPATFLQELREASALREARRESHHLGLAMARFDKVMQRRTTTTTSTHAGGAEDAAPLYTEMATAIACPTLRPSWDALCGASCRARCGCVLRRRQLTTEEQLVTPGLDARTGSSIASPTTAVAAVAEVGGGPNVSQYYRLLCIQPQDRGAAGLVSYRQAVFATPLWQQTGGLLARRLKSTAEDSGDAAAAAPLVIELHLALPMADRRAPASQPPAVLHHSKANPSLTTRTSTTSGLTASPTGVSTTRTALSSVRTSLSSPGMHMKVGRMHKARLGHGTASPRVARVRQPSTRVVGAAAATTTTTPVAPSRVSRIAGLHSGGEKVNETPVQHDACIYLTVMEYQPRRHIAGGVADVASTVHDAIVTHVDPTSDAEATEAATRTAPKTIRLEVMLVYSYDHLDAVLRKHTRATHGDDAVSKEVSPVKNIAKGMTHHATTARQPILLRVPAIIVH